MKQHRFIGSFDLTQTHMEVRERALVHQIARVLKLRAGEEVMLSDGAGKQAVALLERVTDRALGLQILSVEENKNESPVRVTLYASIIKHELFEWVVQKATEVGVYMIVPIVAARTVKRTVRLERLRQIAKEAAELAGRAMVPGIADPLVFEKALTHASAQEVNFFFNAGAPDVRVVAHKGFKTAGVCVGPEGGWEESEMELARAAHFKMAGLGPLTLRAETAAVIASYMILHV